MVLCRNHCIYRQTYNIWQDHRSVFNPALQNSKVKKSSSTGTLNTGRGEFAFISIKYRSVSRKRHQRSSQLLRITYLPVYYKCKTRNSTICLSPISSLLVNVCGEERVFVQSVALSIPMVWSPMQRTDNFRDPDERVLGVSHIRPIP